MRVSIDRTRPRLRLSIVDPVKRKKQKGVSFLLAGEKEKNKEREENKKRQHSIVNGRVPKSILPFSISVEGYAIFAFTVSASLVFNQYINPVALAAIG